MSLNNASILSGGTTSTTGGTALAFESYGSQQGSNVIFATADVDLRTRREIALNAKTPKPSAAAPNGYTQARAVATIKYPKVLANGKITVNTLQISMAYDVEASDADKTALLSYGAQVLSDSDFTGFFKNLSVA